VSNALLDGLLNTITDFIQTMFAPDANGNPTSGGILTEPLDFRCCHGCTNCCSVSH
jgi:hypothetical protein